MFARLTALVSSGSSLPFELGEPFPSSWGAWTHYRATAKADGSAVSVFRVSAAAKQDPKLVAARNGVRRLKMVGAAVRARACGRCDSCCAGTGRCAVHCLQDVERCSGARWRHAHLSPAPHRLCGAAGR